MKFRHSIILSCLGVLLLCISPRASAQEKAAKSRFTVVDEEGKPVKNADIYSGSAYAKTNAQGVFTIAVEAGADLVVVAKGFEKASLSSADVLDQPRITLKKAALMYAEEDKVNLAFRKSYQGDIVGSVTKLDVAGIQKYDHTLRLVDVIAGRSLGMIGNDRIRGLGRGITIEDITGSGTGRTVFVVDGLPRDIDNMRLTEVESITILKDVNSAILYGTDAVNGVVLITTKRGEAFKKRSDFSVNYGISTPRALPGYLNSADYMTYFNQARVNDGLAPQFTDETIENFRSGNKYRFPDVDYYSDAYLRSFKNYYDLNSEFSGGNNVAQYYANLGWNNTGSLMNFGEGASGRNNRFNVRGNVDLKVNDWIKTAVDVSGVFISNKGPRGNYWSDAAAIRPHEYTPLLPINLMDPSNPLLLARKNDLDGEYLLGGVSNRITTPFGNGYSGGTNEVISRNFAFNNRVDVKLDKVTKGLSFHTNVSFDYFVTYNQTVTNEYSVYEPVWSSTADSIIDLKQYGKDSRPGTQSVSSSSFRRRFGAYGMLGYDREFNQRHHFTGNLLGFLGNYKVEGDFQGIKLAHAGLRLGYAYDKRYLVDFSSAYVSSVKLAEGNRGQFSPSLGLAWVLTEEDFMPPTRSVNYLKLRASAGILNSDFLIDNFFLYDNRYVSSGSYNWFEGGRSRNGIAASWGSNPNLGYARRKEVTLGLEGLFFNKVLGVNANLFYNVYDNLVSKPSARYPGFYSDFVHYENFGANMYKGVELGVDFTKSFGDWTIFAGVNVLYNTSEVRKMDEIYDNDYQYRKGHPTDARFGLEALGLFQDEAEIAASPQQVFGAVRPGDIKYKDQNGDNIIDENDEKYLGRYQQPFAGGLQIKVSYRNITLYALGEGAYGADEFLSGNYYWVDGNKKYSDVVLNSWTPANKTNATYPRLSSQTNNNNHRQSTYWKYDNDFFQIRRVQLSYDMPASVSKLLLMRALNIFADASNVYQFSKSRRIRDLSIGGEPNYRVFSIGLNASF
ncbi:SusC/RagA family TonB-linked outer membrane protein [Chitinophaga sp. YIM B06452]|uniref:SusC/RagA family TonB-linked outer membrane protein n=1 Tax=Chitinophaga sp. YIM B06452 TaxID=3082158 RepID=UPI0031FF411D